MWKCRENRGRILLLFILGLFFIKNSFAITYYISSSGNNSNNGQTSATAWLSIGKLNTVVLLPGDQVLFEGGQIFPGNIQLLADDAGDPSNPVVFSSFGLGRAIINAGNSYGFYAYNTGGFSITNLIFDGNSVSTSIDTGIKVYSDLPGDVKFKNISISNVEVKNFGGMGVAFFTTQGLTGFEDVVLDHVSVHDVTNNGIALYGEIRQNLVGWAHKNVLISNCEAYNVPGSGLLDRLEGSGIVIASTDIGMIENSIAHDNGQNNKTCGGPGGIWTLESRNITIQYCESYKNHSGQAPGCDGVGFDLDGGVTNSILQYNYSHDNDGAGYLLGQFNNARPWGNNTVRYNISVNDAVTNEGGIGLFKGNNTSMDGIDIYNNTVYISPQATNQIISAAYLQLWNTGIKNAAFYNNIFVTTGGVPLIAVPTGYDAVFAGNVYWTTGGAFHIYYHGIDYTSLNAFRAGTNNEIVNTVNTGISADPLLTNAGSNPIIGYGKSVQTLNAYKISNNTSPANGAALDLSALFSIDSGPTDFWGTLLPGGTFNSIGGNQYVSALPVTLLSFNGSCTGSQNRISWITAEESNMKSFELLYSSDGSAFKKIAEIAPGGSHTQYKYVYDSASAGNNYYQLRMTDLDGTYKNSSILNVRCAGSSAQINVWPNPFLRSLTISIESSNPGIAGLVLSDGTGKIVSRKEVAIWPGSNQISLEALDGLAAGIYFLRVNQQDKTDYFKLIKTGN